MPSSAELIAEVRRLVMAPNTATLGTEDADILAFANQEMRMHMVPLVMSVREEFFVLEEYKVVTSGVERYRLPRYAIGGKLRDVLLEQNGTRSNLQRLEPEQAVGYYGKSGTPEAFMLQSGKLILLPTPNNSTDRIVFHYFCAPGTLTTTTSLAATAVYYTAPYLTVDPGYVSGNIHIYQNREPYHTLAADLALQNYAGTDATYYYYGPLKQFVDDDTAFATLAHVSEKVQLPSELYPILVHRTASRLMGAVRDLQSMAYLEQQADKLQASALAMLSPRVEGEPKKIRGGILKAFGGW